MVKKVKAKISSVRKFIENWKGFDHATGIINGMVILLFLQLIWSVDRTHLWDLFRFHVLDIILAVVALGCVRHSYMIYDKRGIPKYKTDWPVFFDRNGLSLGLVAIATLAVALIDQEFTLRVIAVFK